jgi:plastocyanin
MHGALLHLIPILGAEKSKTAFYIAAGTLVAWALIVSFLGIRSPDFPGSLGGQRVVMAISVVLVGAAMGTAVITANPPSPARGATLKAAPGTASPAANGTVQVAYRNILIDKPALVVKAGTTVKWTNYDPVLHNVTVQSGPVKFASPNFNQGGTYRYTFTKPGVYHYLCTIHPASMVGTVTVVP